MNKRKRLEKIIEILKKEYKKPDTALSYKTPFQLLIATILSAQCTDERVNKITPYLFKKYKTVKSFADADLKELEQDIKSTGFYRNKAKNIKNLSNILIKDFKGKVPDNMENLLKLPGVARKTANIVLSSAFRKAEGIAVDTHVRRLSKRLGLSEEKEPNKIEQDLMKIVPEKYWLEFNYLLVDHGRAICQARKPKCEDCKISHLCPSRNNA